MPVELFKYFKSILLCCALLLALLALLAALAALAALALALL